MRLEQKVSELIEGFDAYARTEPPFTQEQFSAHVKTLRLRRNHTSVSEAIADDQFCESLKNTLYLWGIWKRSSRPSSEVTFSETLRAQAEAMQGLEDQTLGQLGRSEAADIADELWTIFSELRIADNDTTLVPCTKALHHVLPDLVVPIDRAHGQPFFGGFQYATESIWHKAFREFNRIAREVDLLSYVDPELQNWNTSRTKVLDNALIAYVRELKRRRNVSG